MKTMARKQSAESSTRSLATTPVARPSSRSSGAGTYSWPTPETPDASSVATERYFGDIERFLDYLGERLFLFGLGAATCL